MTKHFIGFCLFSVAVAVPVLFATETERKEPATARQLQIKCKVSMASETGKLDVIAAPSVITSAGQPATIRFTDAKGQSIEIELIGLLIPSEKSEIMNPVKSKE